jgi:hypothetical protein
MGTESNSGSVLHKLKLLKCVKAAVLRLEKDVTREKEGIRG